MVDELIEYYKITQEEIDFQVFHTRLCHGIARAIKAKGWSQSEFAKKMGVDKSLISRWLGGVHIFGEDTLYKMQKLLGVNIFDEDFLNEEDEYNFSDFESKKDVTIILSGKPREQKTTEKFRKINRPSYHYENTI
jgi:transcriptional regulator with XRE-family HTH domain